MSIIGLGIAAFEFYLYSLNRKQYYRLLDEMDDMRKPMMNTTMSMSTINSKISGGGPGSGHMINFGPHPGLKMGMPMQRMNQSQYTPSIGGDSNTGILPQMASTGQVRDQNFVNPLQNIQNMSGRFSFNKSKPVVSTPSDRYLINDQIADQN